ncbi:MAG: hypothetical protein DIZ80_01360 [endosymbiont of Galathealinum brachiosum]|uniref:Uncharacterized protein n=1 Tax=endosymbiont of Galathealinum brachiosum TaxID=2200906 RepID=A0A370DML1_9GAMM|nr:MAG: hypothetical protein DIZ80_01360 [endosymbiont of Galathealinum brachiosum]
MSEQTVSALGDQAFALFNGGDLQGAKVLYEKICSLDLNNPEATMMLGVIKADSGDLSGAEFFLQKALALDPEYADVFFYIGHVLQAKGQLENAVKNLERAVELDPEFNEAKKLLNELQMKFANALLQQGKLQQAAESFQKITQQQPQLPIGWVMLAQLQAQQGAFAKAEQCCLEAIRLDENMLDTHLLLASILLNQGKVQDANHYSDRALQLDSGHINAIALAANIAKHLGNPKKAYDLLSPLLEQGIQQVNVALAFAMISKDLGCQQQAIALMKKILLSDTTLSVLNKINLNFNLGLLYDNIEDYDNAFLYYQQGNDLKPVSFDAEAHTREIDRLISVHSQAFMENQPRSNIYSERPIFVLGMVRSGTSLVEQILSSHGDVFGAGELGNIYQMSKELPSILETNDEYPECLSQLTQKHTDELSKTFLDHLTHLSLDAKRVVDKLPGNFMYLGLIESLFPGARVIHCIRDPLDTCLSTYFQDFSTVHSYAYDLTNLGAYYQSYRKLMSHWRKVLSIPVLELNYEELVNDQEKVSRSLVEFCGLEWDDNCLKFHDSKRVVRTASYDQVNKPLHTKSVARWKNYEKHLTPLITALNNKH